MTDRPILSKNLERALRWASAMHQGQARRGSGVPYFEHVVGVALVLDRLGFSEGVVIAGLLHDVVEDTDATLDDVLGRFGAEVASLVAYCSEVKTDAEGRKRAWTDRKRDHLAALTAAPADARAVALADKLHNLISIGCDLDDGLPVWSHFHADRDSVLWYYRAVIDACRGVDPKLEALASECRRALERVEGFEGRPSPENSPDDSAARKS